MSRFLPDRIDPTRSIEWVISVFTFVGGLYIFSPLYQTSIAQNGLTPFASTLNHPIVISIWGGLLVVGAMCVIFGLAKDIPQLKSIGWFNIFLARFFQILTTILVAGFLPITWIYPLTITVVVALLWGFARLEVFKRA